MTNIPFIDLQAQHAPIRHEIDQAIARVLDSGQFIRGPFVRDFEQQVADYVGTKHAIGVSSGTDALLASLMALRVGPGDEVITTPFTFCASAECILRVGATPVFVDIDPATFNLDAALFEDAITERTRAILPVHLFGQCCQMDRILQIARRHDLHVVEDCAQAMGARYLLPERTTNSPRSTQGTRRESNRPSSVNPVSSVVKPTGDDRQWKQAGSMGDVGCFSFFPTKNLGGIGDGGMITCNDDALAERIRAICSHGCERKYEQSMVGGNFRLDAIQAAVLGVKLAYLDEWIEQRRGNARLYDEALRGVDGVVTPVEADGCWHTYNQYTVRVGDRAGVCERIKASGIGHGVYYRTPLHHQEAYAESRWSAGELSKVEQVCGEVLSLPVFGELDADTMGRIATALTAGAKGTAS
jgi:dTDP-4-amino-4,6-dideoxygalactose transaminase